MSFDSAHDGGKGSEGRLWETKLKLPCLKQISGAVITAELMHTHVFDLVVHVRAFNFESAAGSMSVTTERAIIMQVIIQKPRALHA